MRDPIRLAFLKQLKGGIVRLSLSSFLYLLAQSWHVALRRRSATESRWRLPCKQRCDCAHPLWLVRHVTISPDHELPYPLLLRYSTEVGAYALILPGTLVYKREATHNAH